MFDDLNYLNAIAKSIMLIHIKLLKIYKKLSLFLKSVYLITNFILHPATCVMPQCSRILPVCLINSSLIQTCSYSCISGYIEIPLNFDMILIISSKCICLYKQIQKNNHSCGYRIIYKKTKYIFISMEKALLKKNDNNSK